MTAGDIATLEKVTGTSSFSELEAAAPDSVQHYNTALQEGTVTGDLAQYMPEASLTASDDLLLEKMTGTSSVGAAMGSSEQAFLLGMNIASDRQDGSLTGDISAGYLNGLLATAQQVEMQGSYGHTVSSSFLEKAIDDLQSGSAPSNGKAVNASA